MNCTYTFHCHVSWSLLCKGQTLYNGLYFSSPLTEVCQIEFHLFYLLVEIKSQCWVTEAQAESSCIRETWSSCSIFEIRRISRPNSNEPGGGGDLWCYYCHRKKGRFQVAYIRWGEKAFLSWRLNLASIWTFDIRNLFLFYSGKNTFQNTIQVCILQKGTQFRQPLLKIYTLLTFYLKDLGFFRVNRCFHHMCDYNIIYINLVDAN